MDDNPAKIALAMRISRKCLRIVYENIVFALAVKAICLILGALGIAGKGLDLDDLGAHLGQDADGGRGGHVGAHLDDLDAGERAVTVELLGDCHRSISPFMQVVGRAVRLFASLSSQGKEPLSTDKIEYVCKIDSKLSRKYH